MHVSSLLGCGVFISILLCNVSSFLIEVYGIVKGPELSCVLMCTLQAVGFLT